MSESFKSEYNFLDTNIQQDEEETNIDELIEEENEVLDDKLFDLIYDILEYYREENIDFKNINTNTVILYLNNIEKLGRRNLGKIRYIKTIKEFSEDIIYTYNKLYYTEYNIREVWLIYKRIYWKIMNC